MNQNNAGQSGGLDGSNGGNGGGGNGSGPNGLGGAAGRLQPHQATRLVLAYQNEIRQARAAGDDRNRAQEHLNRAEQIKLILVKYQQQRARIQQQQQQPQQQQSGGGVQNQGSMLGSAMGISAQDSQQQLPQSLPQMGTQIPQNMNFQQLQLQPASSVPPRLAQSAQSPPLMAGTPGVVRTPNSALSSPMMGNQQNPQMRAAQQNRPPVSQQQQQQQQQLGQGANRGQFPNANANANANPNATGVGAGTGAGAGAVANAGAGGANNNISIEKFNLLRTKYEEISNLLQQCEKRKQVLQNPAEVEKLDNDINQLKERAGQYRRLILYVKNQLIARQTAAQQAGNAQAKSAPQASAPANTGAGAGAGTGAVGSAPAGTQGFPQGMASSPAMVSGPKPAVRPPIQQQPQPQVPLQQQQQQNRSFPQLLTTPLAPVSATPRHLPVTAPQPINASMPTSGQSSPPPGLNPAGDAGKPALTPVPGQKPGSTPASASAAGTPGATGKQPTKTTPAPLQPGRPSPTPNAALASITRHSVPSIPISNTINVKPPQAVTLKPGSSRPTITGGVAVGMGPILGTPAITKLPTFELASGSGAGGTIQDNGGRVLTKRKLSELVNTIGADEGDGKTVIDGDVEELLLDLADEFISSVTSFACRLAKHRKVDTLDVRDVQLHLERNWNIRIPGYAMDEIKATRKWQPSTSYNQKLQGVEIAKSVNGNLK